MPTLSQKTIIASGFFLIAITGILMFSGEPTTSDFFGRAVAQTSDSPTANDDYASTTPNESANIDVLANDDSVPEIGTVSTDVDEEPTGVRINGNYAFVSDLGLRVYDISDRSNPSLVDTVDINNAQLRDIAIDGNYLYAPDSGNDKLQIFDISDKTNVQKVADVAFNSSWGAESIDIEGGYAFVLDNNPGELHVIDISTPTSPNITGSNTSIGQFGAKDLEVDGSYAYVADLENDEMRVFGVSDKSNPQLIGAASVGSSPETLDVSGDTVFMGGTSGVVEAIDVSDRTNPNVIDSVDVSPDDDITSLYVAGDRLYYVGKLADGVRAVDISDPTNMRSVWDHQLGDSPERVIMEGGYLYAVDSGSDLLYVLDPSKIDSVTQPDNGSVTLESDDTITYKPDGSATGTATFAYQISGTDGSSDTAQVTVDVLSGAPAADFSFSPADPNSGDTVSFDASSSTDPSNDVQSYSWKFSQGSNTSSLTLSTACCVGIGFNGDEIKATLIVTDDDGNRNTLTRYVPSRSGTSGPSDFEDITAVDDPISGRYCASTNGDATQVDVLANDVNSKITATTTAPGKVTSIRTRGDYAYVGGYRFNIYDISNPSNPTQVASLRYSSGALNEQQIRDIQLDGDYAYLPDSTAPDGNGKWGSSVYVIDISDPTNPFVADSISYENGYYQGIWGSESVDMRGDDLFVVDPNPSDLYAIDAGDPTSLQRATTTALSEVPAGHPCRLKGNRCDDAGFGKTGVFKAKEVRVKDNYAYTVHRSPQNEVRVFDISNPSDVSQAGSVSVMSQPETIEVAGDKLYVAGDDDTFQVFDISTPTSPAKLGELNAFPNGDSDVTSVHYHEGVLYATHRPEGSQAEDSPLEDGIGGVVAIDVSSPSNPEKLWATVVKGAPEGITWHNGSIYVVSSNEANNTDASLLSVLDPDNGYIEIDGFTQPTKGTVTLNDQGTSDPTDDELSYIPSATGTDSFTYSVSGDPTEAKTVGSQATVSFHNQQDQCDTADISASSSPANITLYSGSSTVSWEYEDVSNCETQNGTTQWRNIDPMASANCPEGVEDGSCSGSDSAEITNIGSDTTFTLACDTANDGDNSIDTSTSTTVSVTDLASCPFTEGSGSDEYDQVITIEEPLSSDASKDETGDYIANLSPGEYQVGFFGYDDARGTDDDRTAENETSESWYAEFTNSDGSYTTTTSITNDIPDDSQLGTSTTLLSTQFDQSIDSLRGLHAARKDSNTANDAILNNDDFTAGCMAIDQQTSNPTANISASTTSIPYNGSTTLDWAFSTVSNGTTTSNTGNTQWANTDVFADTQACQSVGDGLCNGSHSTDITNLTQDTEFTITFDGTYGGSVSDSVSVDVADKPVDLNVDLSAVQLGDDAQLTWNETNMNNCIAGSDPTQSQWASSTNPDPSGGTTTINGLATSTEFTLTCSKDDTTISDAVSVEVIGFDTAFSVDNLWGVPFANGLTTQSRISFETTDSFSDQIELSASVISSPDYSVELQFLDNDGNLLSATPVIDQTVYDDNIWLQAQVGPGVETGRQQVQITADAVVGTSSTSQIIDMFIRGSSEQ
jgi:hypothetical protein